MTIYVSNLAGDFPTTGAAFASAGALRGAAPHAWPNRRSVALADTVLDRAGQLRDAVPAMGAASPETMGTLVALPAGA